MLLKSVYWVRTDLRLHDNQTLTAFCNESDYGVLLWAPTLSTDRAGRFRAEYIRSSLECFSESLSHVGQNLVIGQESIEHELLKIFKTESIERLYFTREFAQEEVAKESRVTQLCHEYCVQVKSYDQSTLVAERDLPFGLNELPDVFTHFRKKIEQDLAIKDPLALPNQFPKPFLTSEKLTISERRSLAGPFEAGEKAGLNRLEDYLKGTHSILTYKETRNGMIHVNDSTKLSPWLNQGSLSVRQVYKKLVEYEQEFESNESTYWLKFELLWRDYFKFLSRKYKSKIFRLEGLDGVRPEIGIDAEARFENWKSSRCQDEFIDANMNELNQTGWMSNRGRQNVASYLIHILNVPWTWGAAYFEEMLIDYDPDLNWGNWLYLSGRGTDPRSRIFNSARQAEQYDQNREYRLKWGKRE